MTTPHRPVCSLSLDLDNLWSYMKTHGDPGWEIHPSYLDLVIPRILEIIERYRWTITFFIVGQDAAMERNCDALRSIAAAGHEIGNHSYHHEPWLHLYTKERTEEEISRAAEAIESATGYTPHGFRGPGYSISRATIEVLSDSGYIYDGSTLPTFLGPLARAYYFQTSDLSDEEKEQRKILFGTFNDGFRPLKPYLWAGERGDLLEIPVTTLPIIRLPFHFSYLLYIGTRSKSLARLYFRSALAMCRLMGVEPSLLLHPLDFLGRNDVPELEFFPAMTAESRPKIELLTTFFDLLSTHFDVVSMERHARVARQARQLPKIDLALA